MTDLKPLLKDTPRQNAGGGRSAIPSPYFDLQTSINVGDVVYNKWGGACSPDQLAVSLGYKSTASGTYLTRIAAATKHFGLIDVNGDRISITERAKKILAPVMPDDAVSAKVDAFLSVQLFARIYDEFKGGQLPPEVGLKNLLLNKFGVLPDRVAQALRVFYSSAEQAGFFQAAGDRSRLINPRGAAAVPPPAPAGQPGKSPEPPPPAPPGHPAPPPLARSTGGGGSDGTGGVHSAIIGLLRDLPPPGTDWPKKQKARFVKAFQATLDFVYPDDDDAEVPQ